MATLRYPNIAQSAPLHYDWQGYSEVQIFFSEDVLEVAKKDYVGTLGLEEGQVEEPGKLEFYLDKKESILLADCEKKMPLRLSICSSLLRQ